MAMEDSAQRKIHVGVAKKIKNGARKIVLEKAEEARVAAFSAFKSLGLDVPQFSCSLLSISTGKGPQKTSSSSSGEESTSGYAVLQHSKHILDAPSVGDKHEIAAATTGIEGNKSINPPAAGFASVKENIAGNTQGEILVEKPEECSNTLDYKLSITAKCISSRNGTISHPLTDLGDIKNQSGEHLDQVGQRQPENENKCMKSRQNTLEKGPVNVTSIPGGLDSFLDLWDATKEFFFDVHFTKKSELNSIAPFEIHGIAICWENSPVYYLNISKDLFRCSSQGNEHSLSSKDVLLPQMQVEMAMKRWTRIGTIMGRKDVKKFAWNLKVQIQVFKTPAVAFHKFSSLHGGIKSLGLDLIDNSYYMFSPVYVRVGIDMGVVAWILSPDEEKSSYPNLEKVNSMACLVPKMFIKSAYEKE